MKKRTQVLGGLVCSLAFATVIGATGQLSGLAAEDAAVEAELESENVQELEIEDEYLELAAALQEAGVTLSDIEAAGGCWVVGDVESEREYRFAVAAANLGSGEAALKLGEWIHSYSVEVANETEDAVALAMYYWELAGENGTPRGYADIGLIYLHRSVPGGGDEYGSVEYDEETAFRYFELATEGGDAKGARYLGECYRDGIGVEQSYEKAFEYFSIAAERADSTATVYVADYLLEGIGTEQDVETALSMYQEIVDNEDHDLVACAYKLGVIYEEGVYVEVDVEKAAEYYQIVLDNSENTESETYMNAAEALERLSE